MCGICGGNEIAILGAGAGALAGVAIVADTFRARFGSFARRLRFRSQVSEAPAVELRSAPDSDRRAELRPDDCGRRATDEIRAELRAAVERYDSALDRLALALANAKRK